MGSNHVAYCVSGLAIVGAVFYAMHMENQSRGVTPQQDANEVGLNAFLSACTDQEHFRAHNVVQGQGVTYTPHRYPTVSGGNITSVIHHGMSALARQPDFRDAMWVTRPPAEVMQ